MISSGKKMMTNCLNDPQGYEEDNWRRAMLSLCSSWICPVYSVILRISSRGVVSPQATIAF